ncbi:hypothetical protein B0H21DRAFT_700727 [Amylocystis lapponica]|nr:hypothetical protein B0H21DRAFT_700727 [Amylocystis lapponica]
MRTRAPSIASLKSPSSPNLIARRTPSPHRPGLASMRANSLTLPTLTHRASPSLEGLSMDPARVVRLRRWISSLVIGMRTLDFDLELGPKLSGVYPPLSLSPSEAENIAFSSFPDSPQFDQGSQVHSFRIRIREAAPDKLQRAGEERPKTEDGFIYGFSHFTQRRDASFKRGYQQRSLVILTHLPYPALFHTFVGKLGPAFLAHGGPMLEAACHNIAKWSDPLPGATLELGFLGSVFTVELPSAIDTQQSPPAHAAQTRKDHDPAFHILVSVPPQDPPVFALFEASLTHLWSLWECLVLCEPLLIFAPSPAMTSQAVWWLRDLLKCAIDPLAGDFRPFFTIHDADHGALVNARAPSAGLLLGVTNPFFERACKHWPHVLSLGRDPPTKTSKSNGIKDLASMPGPPPGWTTRTHKRYTSRDRTLLKQLQDACGGPESARQDASAALHRHFSARTAALLVPLQRYLQTLIPTPSEAHAHAKSAPPSVASFAAAPGNGALRMRPFSERDFLASLKMHGAPLPFKSTGRAREFYARWLRTPAFGRWIARQEEVVQGVLRGLS